MTSTPEQVIAKIREALEAGPTPGPWGIKQDRVRRQIFHVVGPSEIVSGPDGICSPHRVNDRTFREDEANQRFIAACNPQNIAVLMGEITDLQSVVQCMNEDFAAVKAERDALRKALEPFAAEAPCYDPDTGDGDDSVWATPINFKIRDLRRARTLLAGDNHG